MGHLRILDARTEPSLATQIAPAALLARTERVFVLEVKSFDRNCPQYITPRYTTEEIETVITAPLRARIAELEACLRASDKVDSR